MVEIELSWIVVLSARTAVCPLVLPAGTIATWSTVAAVASTPRPPVRTITSEFDSVPAVRLTATAGAGTGP